MGKISFPVVPMTGTAKNTLWAKASPANKEDFVEKAARSAYKHYPLSIGPTVTERDLETVIALIDAQDLVETVAVSSDLAVLLCERLNADDFVVDHDESPKCKICDGMGGVPVGGPNPIDGGPDWWEACRCINTE